MAIPTRQLLRLEILNYLSDFAPHTLKETIKHLTSFFNLTDDEKIRESLVEEIKHL